MIEELHHIIQDGPRITEYYCRSDGTQITILEILTYKDADIVIPEYIEGLPVTTIARACKGNRTIRSIELPKTVEVIAPQAFMYCTHLVTVDLSACSKLRNIPQQAFYGCQVLQSVYKCYNLSEIGKEAFGKCPMLGLIVYPRTEAAWNAINVREGNEDMSEANIQLVVPTISLGMSDAELCVNTALKLVPILSHPGCPIVWETSNPDVASVDNGRVTALSSGLATITASICYDGQYATASCAVLCYNYHLCRFVDYDGSLIAEKRVRYLYRVDPPSSPYRPATVESRYIFTGWDQNLICMGDTTFVAQYAVEPVLYRVQFRDPDGKILSDTRVPYGSTVTPPEMPSTADEKCRYKFISWDKEIVPVTVDAVYTAIYDTQYIDYTVSFYDYDGTLISTRAYHHGDTVAVPDIPTRESDNTYCYTFVSWGSEVGPVTRTCKYTAEYKQEYLHEGGLVQVGAAVGVPGEKVSIHVSLTKNVGVSGGLHTVTFDPKLFTFSEVKMCEQHSGCGVVANTDNAADGSVNVLWYSGADISASEEIYEIVFDVSKEAADGVYTVGIAFEESGNVNASGHTVHFDPGPGTIQIGDSVSSGPNVPGGGSNYTQQALVALAKLVADTDRTPTAAEVTSSDMNADSFVNLHDVVLLAQRVPVKEDEPEEDEPETI